MYDRPNNEHLVDGSASQGHGLFSWWICHQGVTVFEVQDSEKARFPGLISQMRVYR